MLLANFVRYYTKSVPKTPANARTRDYIAGLARESRTNVRKGKADGILPQEATVTGHDPKHVYNNVFLNNPEARANIQATDPNFRLARRYSNSGFTPGNEVLTAANYDVLGLGRTAGTKNVQDLAPSSRYVSEMLATELDAVHKSGGSVARPLSNSTEASSVVRLSAPTRVPKASARTKAYAQNEATAQHMYQDKDFMRASDIISQEAIVHGSGNPLGVLPGYYGQAAASMPENQRRPIYKPTTKKLKSETRKKYIDDVYQEAFQSDRQGVATRMRELKANGETEQLTQNKALLRQLVPHAQKRAADNNIQFSYMTTLLSF